MNEKQIQEVMALVDEFGDSRRRQGNDEYSPESVNRRYAAQYGKDANELHSAIESALREQVREAPDKLPPFEQPDGADYGESHEEGYVSGWNACVDAMLSAAPQREPMTDEQAFKSWKALREMKPSINAMSAFQAGIDLAERFHNITKEQQ